MKIENTLLKICFIPILYIGIMICSSSCTDENEKDEQSQPFKSVFVTVDNERVQAEVVDGKHLSLSFETAENFSEAKLDIALNDGYELIFPTDKNKADMANYPVLNFRAPDNRIVKYWFNIFSKAFPIVDETKIGVLGLPNDITVQNSTKEVLVNFNKSLMDMSKVELHFEEGALMEGAEIVSDLLYDFTQDLTQNLIIKLGGIDRLYKVRLNVATAMGDPKSYGFTNVTNNFIDAQQYPFVSVYTASSVAKVPVRNDAPETPWSWDVSWDKVPEYLAYIGDWSVNRSTETINNTLFAIATMDIKKAYVSMKSNNQTQIAVKDAGGLITMSGKPLGENTMLYWNGQVLSRTNTSDAGWRAAVGFDEEGRVSFYNASIQDEKMIRMPNYDSYPDNYLTTASDWDVISAACGHPWLVRNGHCMTRLEMYVNDATNWEVALGEAWNGTRARSFMGITYDNKVGCAVVADGMSTCQAAWVLEKLGWKEVFYVGGNYYMANDFVPTLCVNGKLVVGDMNQQAQYCVAIDAK